MKKLSDVEVDGAQLEVYECTCGFHIGIDATFLEQVGPVLVTCPSCDKHLRFPSGDCMYTKKDGWLL
jgi:hypothetical protein